MPRYLVGIAQGDEISDAVRTELSDAGFRAAGEVEISEAVWATDERRPQTAVHRLMYYVEADDERSAISKTLAVVGPGYDVSIASSSR